MKKSYPRFTDINKSFNSLSKNNQKIITDFLTYCRTEAKESTLEKYRIKLIQIAFLIEKPLDNLNLIDITKFLALLNFSDLATDTRNDIKKILKRFLKWKYDDWNIRFKGLTDIRQKKKGSSEKLTKKDLLTAEELEMLIRGAESLRYKAIISLFYESAGRPEEILKLRWKDVDFKNKEIQLNSSKTGEARVVPLDESILHLKRYFQEYPFLNPKQSDFLFPNNEREKTISNQALNDYLNKIGLRTIKRHIYPYIFRHTRLQEIRPKLSVEAYQKIAGHSIEVALDHYGHLDSKDAIEEMKSKVLHIEELNPEEKHEIAELKKQVKAMQSEMIRVAQLVADNLNKKGV